MKSSILSVSFAHRQSHLSAHFHDCHQILFITQGSAAIALGNAVHTAQAGDLVIFSRFEQHAVTSRSCDYQRYVLQIAPQCPQLSPESQRLFSILANRPVGFSNILPTKQHGPAVQQLMERMYCEHTSGGLLSQDLLDLLVQELLILICRLCPEVFSAFAQDRMDIVYQLQRRFEQEYAAPVSLSSLAEDYGLSASHLSHLFKKVTGSSVMGYLLSCRIAAAKKLLAETTMGIGQIVERCGFSDCSNFSRTFRQLCGCSPSQFRSRYQSH